MPLFVFIVKMKEENNGLLSNKLLKLDLLELIMNMKKLIREQFKNTI